MNGAYDRTRVIIGFRDFFDLDDLGSFQSAEVKAESVLNNINGFHQVIRKFEFLNAVLTEIDPAVTERFVATAERNDYIEYCDYNYYLHACSYTDAVHPTHLRGETQDQAFLQHRHSKNTGRGGAGTRIALIDTGISPHPYLPALSFTEAASRPPGCRKAWRSDGTDQLLHRLRTLESGLPLAYTNRRTHQNLAFDVHTELTTFLHNCWLEWEHELRNWINAGRGSGRPNFPDSRGLLGSLRIISPDSWNFVDNNPNVLDLDGHGTGMAGCIAGMPPATNFLLPDLAGQLNFNPAPHRAPYSDQLLSIELPEQGLAPFSELMVLKCLAAGKANETTADLLNDALAHCLRTLPDLIYFGCEIQSSGRPQNSITKLLLQLARESVIVIAPAGNGGACGMTIPASIEHVNAITSGVLDARLGLIRESYSNFADLRINEKVKFCATGGSKETPILILSLDFGFTYEAGTSISAAVATGLWADAFAVVYKTDIDRTYNNFLGHGIIVAADIRQEIEKWQRNANIENRIHNALTNCSYGSAPGTEDEFGYGFVRY